MTNKILIITYDGLIEKIISNGDILVLTKDEFCMVKENPEPFTVDQVTDQEFDAMVC